MPTTEHDLAFLPVHEMASAMAAGRLTSARIVETFLKRIERHESKLQAFVSVYAEDALRAARAADEAAAAGHRVGPFHGIPIAVKDIVDIEGRITTGGCKVWEKRVSTHTATLGTKLVGAGMVVVG